MKEPSERLLKAELQIKCFGPAEQTPDEPDADLVRGAVLGSIICSFT